MWRSDTNLGCQPSLSTFLRQGPFVAFPLSTPLLSEDGTSENSAVSTSSLPGGALGSGNSSLLPSLWGFSAGADCPIHKQLVLWLLGSFERRNSSQVHFRQSWGSHVCGLLLTSTKGDWKMDCSRSSTSWMPGCGANIPILLHLPGAARYPGL